MTTRFIESYVMNIVLMFSVGILVFKGGMCKWGGGALQTTGHSPNKKQFFLITRKYSNHNNSQKVGNTRSPLVQDHFMNQTVGFLDRNAVVNTSGPEKNTKSIHLIAGGPTECGPRCQISQSFYPWLLERRKYRGLPPGAASTAVYRQAARVTRFTTCG